MAIAAGVCFAVAIIWWPLGWLMKFRADNTLYWLRKRPRRPEWADDRPLERLLGLGRRMTDAWWLAVVSAGAGIILLALAIAGRG